MFVLPDFPSTRTCGEKWLLTEDEQKLVIDRTQRDRVSAPEVNESLMHSLKLAVTDYRTWILVCEHEDTCRIRMGLTLQTVTHALCQSFGIWLERLLVSSNPLRKLLCTD